MVKRSVRLDPAYWVTIVLAILFAWVPATLMGYAVDLPSVSVIAIHMLYLQGLTQTPPIGVVFWSLCYEVQFYLVFLFILMCLRRFGLSELGSNARIYVFTLFFGISFMWPLGYLDQVHPGLFVDLWFLFLLGSFARWALDDYVARGVLLVAVSLLSFRFIRGGALEFAVGAGTAIALFGAASLGKMAVWLSWRWLQYLGMISYSLYLVHDIAGLYVRDTGVYLTFKYLGWSSLLVNYAWFAISLSVSLLAAHLLWRLVEAPSHRLSRSLDLSRAWEAGQVKCSEFRRKLRH